MEWDGDDDRDDESEYEEETFTGEEYESSPDAAGLHEAHGFFWVNSREYAEFLADECGFTHDEIDYWLGYTDD